jgi:thiamine kinase-like enzyme
LKKSRFESELSSLDELMQQDLNKKERKQIVERLRSLIDRVDRYANSGKLPKEAALRIRIDLLYLVKQAKKKDLGSESSRQRLHDLVEHVFSLYRSRPESRRGIGPEEKLMTMLFRSFK